MADTENTQPVDDNTQTAENQDNRRMLIVPCALLFLLGLIALVIGIFLWRSTTSNDNSQVTPTPTPSVTVTDTPVVSPTKAGSVTINPSKTPTPTAKPTTMPGKTVVLQAPIKDTTYVGPYFTATVPAGWEVVQFAGARNAYYITKDNYYILINAAEVTTTGYGYPYNGSCQFDEEKGTYTTSKFERLDNVFNTKNAAYSDFVFYGCGVTKNTQLGDKVWLGSRLIDKGSTMPAINAYKYFGKSQTASSYVYFINYSHFSMGDINAKYPVWGSQELNNYMTVMNKIAGSVVFTKDPSYFTHSDGLG